ncbi:hypothetical protein ACR9PT_14270 [Piscirickettsia salmonis]|uniref:hypothetical protein n=1 Tax=Piscirickettsia salmonis TaxID=1238 RepID=UPI003EBDAE13
MSDKAIQLDQEPPEKRLAYLITSERYSKGQYDACMKLHDKVQSRVNKLINVTFIGVVTIFICNVIAEVSLWFGLMFSILFVSSVWVSLSGEFKVRMMILDEAEKSLNEQKRANELIGDELKKKEQEITCE